MTKSDLYPSTPEGISRQFTEVHPRYKRQVVFVLIAIFLFFLVYLALIVVSGFLVWYSFTYEMGNVTKFTILLKIGTIAMAIMFFVFTLKFLFKRHSFHDPNQIELKASDHPDLFTFIRRLSEETGAPLPKKVFVDHQINASVSYDSTLLSLIFPVRKNLLIGLGLVNSLNLSEFKAVLAHEFGHFSQSSMKLGSYVYIANRIIYTMVAERDSWDDFLERWKSTDIRLSIFAWLLMPVVWLVRKLMALMYQGLNLLQSSLSRQMEFHADKVAVSVTGSNAIVNALYRLGPSAQAYRAAFGQLRSAFDHQMYTDNLFFHHRRAFEWLAQRDRDFADTINRSLPYERAYIFSENDLSVPDMYASHPPNHLREKNAKAEFIAGQVDDRSPWSLFSDPEELAREVSAKVLRNSLGLKSNIEFTPAGSVENFIAGELKELTFDPIYEGIYDERYLNDPDLEKAEEIAAKYGVDQHAARGKLNDLFEELKVRMTGLKTQQKGLEAVIPLLQGAKAKSFSYQGKQYDAGKAGEVYQEIVKAYQSHKEWCKEFDERTFAVHYHLAEEGAVRNELIDRYAVLSEYRVWLEQLGNIQHILQEKVAELNQSESLSENEVNGFIDDFRRIAGHFKASLDQAEELPKPEGLNNFEEVERVRDFLLSEKPGHISLDTLDGNQINQLIRQVNTVSTRGNRLYFKLLGQMLKLQEEIRKE